MKKAGFTLIELIFVIVILGILALVALPKLTGVKEQADEGVIKSFVGTLNRTVGPAKWSASIANGATGSILDNAKYGITKTDTDFPASFTTQTVDTSKCEAATATVTTANQLAAQTSDNKYAIVCRNGTASSAPRFWYITTTAANTAVSLGFDDSKLKLN